MQPVKITGQEIESIMDEMAQEITPHKSHKRDSCPLCVLMEQIEADDKTHMHCDALFRSVASIINPAILLFNHDINEAEARACAMLLMIGIMIGRKQVEVEQLKKM